MMNCSRGQLKLTAKGTAQMIEHDEKPTATYSKVSELIRHATSGSIQCSMFCGGSNCKYCNADRWAGDNIDTVIKGLYSSWVTSEILATSRPTTFAIDNYNIIDQFKIQSIRSIINVQHPGEHANCGRNHLEPDSGFSYDPQDFMENKIFFYNFGWQDYGTASLETILDMVKVMSFALSEGKVAVHCHAGLGRTGVIIACYLIYAHRLTADQAINYIRSKRPGAIQTRGQIDCVQQFYQFLTPLWVVFSMVSTNTPAFTLQQFLKKQRRLLHGFEARQLKYLPKIVYLTCSKLVYTACKTDLQLSKLSSVRESCSSVVAVDIFYNTETESDDQHRERVDLFPTSTPLPVAPTPRRHSLDSVVANSDICKNLKPLVDCADLSVSTENLSNKRHGDKDSDTTRSRMPKPATSSSPRMSRSTRNTLDADNSSMKKMSAKRTAMLDTRVSDTQLLMLHRASALIKGPISKRSLMAMSSFNPELERFHEDHETVAQAMGFNLLLLKDDVINKRLQQYQMELNESDMTWQTLQAEVDPYLLSAVLWAWLEQLKMPLLSAQDIHNLTQQKESPLLGLAKIEKTVYHTIECILMTIGELLPLKPDILEFIIHRMISALTHSISKPAAPSHRHKDTKLPTVEFFKNCVVALLQQNETAKKKTEDPPEERTPSEPKQTEKEKWKALAHDKTDPYYVSSSSDQDGVSH